MTGGTEILSMVETRDASGDEKGKQDQKVNKIKRRCWKRNVFGWFLNFFGKEVAGNTVVTLRENGRKNKRETKTKIRHTQRWNQKSYKKGDGNMYIWLHIHTICE